MPSLRLTSPAFEDGEPIPERYGYDADDVNPPLSIEGVPADAAALAIVMDDPDAVEPAGKIWDHWVVWNVDPGVDEIPADWEATDAVEGRNDYGDVGYGGPNPPDGEHTYRFRLYALREPVALDRGATTADLEDAIRGAVVDEALLEGTFAP
ncbi:MAG: YbhB/YbcL family Raf kinase inhibitor-like protein [Halanaeroarchaeum sp.]